MDIIKRKRLLLIGSIPPPHHGSSIYFFNLLNSKINDIFVIKHIDTSDHRDLKNLSKLDFLNVFLALKNIIELICVLLKFKPDIVYIPPAANLLPYLRDGIFMILSGLLSNAKITIHLHGGNYFRNIFFDKSNLIIRWFIKYSLSKVDNAIVLGNSLQNVFEGLVKNVYVVPNGSEIEPNIKRLYNNNSKIIFGYLGNLFKEKGIIELVKSASIIVQKHPNIQFLIAGEWGNDKDEINSEIKNILMNNQGTARIKFIGKLVGEEKINFLNMIDIFVFPTAYPFEGMPLVIIEAMSQGCPIISIKNVGVISEIICDGENGILLKNNSSSELLIAFEKFINQPYLIENMGKNSLENFSNKYTLEKNINDVIKIFEFNNKIITEK